MQNESLSILLSRLPEFYRDREKAESRAEYLRMGTFKHSKVVAGDRVNRCTGERIAGFFVEKRV